MGKFEELGRDKCDWRRLVKLTNPAFNIGGINMGIIMSKEEQEYWSTCPPTETEIVGRAISDMRSGVTVKLSTKTFQLLIEQFGEHRSYNNFYNISCIYVPYCLKEEEEPYWLCSLHWVPHEVFNKITELEVLHWPDGK